MNLSADAKQYFDIVTLIFETGLGLFLLTRIFTLKKKYRHTAVPFLFYIIHCIPILIQHFITLDRDKFILYLCVHFVMLMLYSVILCSGYLISKIYMVLIYLSCITLCLFPINFLVQLLGVVFPFLKEQSYPNGILYIILPKLLLFGIVYLLLHFRFNAKEDYPFSYSIVMIIAPLLNITSILVLRPYYGYSFTFIIGILTFLMELTVYFMIWQSTSEYSRRIELQMMNQQQDYQYQHMTELKTIVTEYHRLRHDMKNHFICMDRMLSQSQYEQLHQYFYNYSYDFYRMDNQIETGNEIVNQIINIKYAMALKQQIPMNIDSVLPRRLNIPDHKLCAVLCNLLDNAIEASKEQDDPEITIQLKMIEGYLSITVVNKMTPLLHEYAISRKTTKPDPDLHGLGLRIVENIVDAYNGISMFESNKTHYTASVMLEVPEALDCAV